MSNKEILDTLILTNKICISKNVYNVISECDVSAEKILRLTIKYDIDILRVLDLIFGIIKKSLDTEIIDISFEEFYKVYKIMIKHNLNDVLNMICQINYVVRFGLGEVLGLNSMYNLLLRYKVKELETSILDDIWINNKKYDYDIIVKDNHNFFILNDDISKLYSMIIDYDNDEILIFTDRDIYNEYAKIEKLRLLDKEKINLLITCKNKDINLVDELKVRV